MHTPHPEHARRYPGLAAEEDIPEKEREAYEWAVAYSERWAPGTPVVEARLKVGGGQPYAYPYWRAWTNAPGLFKSMMRDGPGPAEASGRSGVEVVHRRRSRAD